MVKLLITQKELKVMRLIKVNSLMVWPLVWLVQQVMLHVRKALESWKVVAIWI